MQPINSCSGEGYLHLDSALLTPTAGSQTLQSLGTRGYHPTTPRAKRVRLDEGGSRLSDLSSPRRDFAQEHRWVFWCFRSERIIHTLGCDFKMFSGREKAEKEVVKEKSAR
ncbi:hypothetical protein DEO72_LG8g942 [Vigna unguiculata]|uniref:Uncharacterized protein n=1 Tax=Vigna unguiculata TaxID=3917 RepID=A0A4D6MN58_VIGUN|nr:hypothetical protein DEO72_LG5g728 [Vigna unguiculata]QCE02926.1 hypothetical protein DEO72_LG8g942 [Vigna unguiculata]